MEIEKLEFSSLMEVEKTIAQCDNVYQLLRGKMNFENKVGTLIQQHIQIASNANDPLVAYSMTETAQYYKFFLDYVVDQLDSRVEKLSFQINMK